MAVGRRQPVVIETAVIYLYRLTPYAEIVYKLWWLWQS